MSHGRPPASTARCRSRGRRAAARAARAARRARRSGRSTRSTARTPARDSAPRSRAGASSGRTRPLGVERRPVRSGVVAAARAGRCAAAGASRPPNAVGARRVHRARPRPSSASSPVERPGSSHSSARNARRRTPEHRGHAAARPARRASAAPAASAAYSPAGASRARLHERAPAVLELDRVRVVDVAAGDPPQRPHGAAGGARRRRPRGSRGGSAISSSSPRQAASTRSSTSSKPSVAAVVRVGDVEVAVDAAGSNSRSSRTFSAALLVAARRAQQVARGSRGRARAAGRSRSKSSRADLARARPRA